MKKQCPCGKDFVQSNRYHGEQIYCSDFCCRKFFKINNPTYGSDWYWKNRTKRLVYTKQWQLNNRERKNRLSRELYLKKRNEILERQKQRRIENPKRYNEIRRKFLETNKEDKIRRRLRDRLRWAIKEKGYYKGDNALKLVGITIPELKKHLESKFKDGMSWENHGKWHIDHIRPLASFDLEKLEEQREAFYYKNLQPLWAEENLRKATKII